MSCHAPGMNILKTTFPTVHDGIPAVLDDLISFYWLPSNLDRL
jgi:hypothetical protein